MQRQQFYVLTIFVPPRDTTRIMRCGWKGESSPSKEWSENTVSLDHLKVNIRSCCRTHLRQLTSLNYDYIESDSIMRSGEVRYKSITVKVEN